MIYWLNSTFAVLPFVLWMFIGLGLPWALAALPRKDWHDKPLVLMCSLAFGPALMTAWMFVLGTVGAMRGNAPRTPDPAPLLSLTPILIGSVILALIGIAIAWRKSRTPAPPRPRRVALAMDERLLIGMIGIALLLRFLSTSFWNFTAYDTLWVYGYQGRLYSLLGYIPTSIGYYPPFVQLQYAYAQLGAEVFTGTLIDDHAARAPIMFLHLGSILAAYVLGKHLFTRRVGVFAAALWALYPHVGEWAQVGDLEIPLTFAFTGAAAFFLKAWLTNERERLYYAALAGLFLGVAMWTKPTAGAFILGVGLLVAAEILRTSPPNPLSIKWRGVVRRLMDFTLSPQPSALYSRLQIAIVTGLASIPLGALWYVRNIAYGHRPIDLPNPFWLTQALQSGAEFGWLLLALVVLLLYLIFAPKSLTQPRPNVIPFLVGTLLIVAAITPTIITPYAAFNVPNRMDALEWLALAAGLAVIGVELWRYGGKYLTPQGKREAAKIGWALILALPYFVTWFISYSYHYRLSFAIVPLMILPTALILAKWTQPYRLSVGVNRRFASAYLIVLVLMALPGTVNTLYTYAGGWDWLWSGEFKDDFARQEATNTALAWTVRRLEEDITAQGIDQPVIVAPGLQRLPFFFPLHDVRNQVAPTRLDELEGVDYYIYSQEAAWYYPENRLPALNQIVGSLNRPNVMEIVGSDADSSFWSITGRLREGERRFRPVRRLTEPSEPVEFGGFARFVGHRMYDDVLELVWEAQDSTDTDYSVLVQLIDTDDTVMAEWNTKPAQGRYAYYATTLWEEGEYIIDPRQMLLPNDLPPDEYRLRIGFDDEDDTTYILSETIRVPVVR
jgi:hypothetical protein